MKKFFTLTLLSLCLHSAYAQPPVKSSEGPWASGQLLVGVHPGMGQARTEALLKGAAPEFAQNMKVEKIGALDAYVLNFKGSETALKKRLEHQKFLQFVELNSQVKITGVPNDPAYGAQWHLPKIGAPQAWDSATGRDVKIAILDTGVNPHPDLVLLPGFNAFDNNTDASDVYGHGTAVAGTAAAAMNNSLGVAGVAGEAKIIPVRISGLDGYAYWSTIAQGLTWAADQGAKVANMSYGVSGSATVQSAANYLKSKGGVAVCSAENDNVNEGYVPTDSLISVAATDQNDNKASFSSFGDYVHLSAPGTGIYTTTRTGGYGGWNGTSFSAPIVAGSVAVLMQANPTLSPAQLRSILFNSAVDLGTPGKDIYFGYGRVNLAAAVDLAKSTQGVDSIAPTVQITSPASGSTVSDLVSITVDAKDNTQVQKVELIVDGVVKAQSFTAPYTFALDTLTLSNGNHTLTTRATDSSNNAATSAAVVVSVYNAANVDSVAPVFTSVSPASGTSFSVGTKVAVRAAATDNRLVSSIKLSINGTQTTTSTGANLSYTWNTTNLPAGSYTLVFTATDSSGNASSTQSTVTLTGTRKGRK